MKKFGVVNSKERIRIPGGEKKKGIKETRKFAHAHHCGTASLKACIANLCWTIAVQARGLAAGQVLLLNKLNHVQPSDFSL